MKYIGKWLLGLLITTCLCVGGYFAYLYVSFERLPAHQDLSIVQKESPQSGLIVNQTYQAMTFNIGYGLHQPSYSNYWLGGQSVRATDKQGLLTNLKAIGQLIANQAPDVVALQEVDLASQRTFQINQADFFGQYLNRYATSTAIHQMSQFLPYPLHDPLGDTKAGLVTLSSFMINQAQRYQLPVTTGLNRFLGLDPAFSVTQIAVEGSDHHLEVINVDLTAFNEADDTQAQQLKQLYAYMEKTYRLGNYVIVAGDFKQDMLEGRSAQVFHHFISLPHFKAQDLPEGFVLANEGLTDKGYPSLRDSSQVYQINNSLLGLSDGFIVSDNITIEGVKVIQDNFEHSYHQPVLLQFKLRASVE